MAVEIAVESDLSRDLLRPGVTLSPAPRFRPSGPSFCYAPSHSKCAGGADVHMPVKSVPLRKEGTGASSLQVYLLGPMAIRRDGAVVALPASRKVRALLGYLAVAPHAVTRSHLCELLWDVPNDPRGELRWCLSKVRGVVDEPGRRRVETHADTVRLDLTGCFVDAAEVLHATRGIETIDLERVRMLSGLLAGDFLEGLEIDRSPAFGSWLTAQRRRFRNYHVALLERLAHAVADDEAA